MPVEEGSRGAAGDCLLLSVTESRSHKVHYGGSGEGIKHVICHLDTCGGVQPPELGHQETGQIMCLIKADAKSLDPKLTTEQKCYFHRF